MAHSTKVSILCRVDHWWFLGEVDGARGLVPAHCVQVGGLLHLVVHGHRGGGDVDTGQPFWQLSFRQWCHRQMFRCWGTTPLCDFWGDISFSKIGASWSGSVCRGIYAKYKYMHLFLVLPIRKNWKVNGVCCVRKLLNISGSTTIHQMRLVLVMLMFCKPYLTPWVSYWLNSCDFCFNPKNTTN